MKKGLSIFLVAVCSIANCQDNKDSIIAKKNLCYQQKLNGIKSGLLYKKVFSQFKDTFPSLVSQKELFGVPESVGNRADDAIFFYNDSSKCILLVLQKPSDKQYVFGNARVIYGNKLIDHWIFKVGFQFYFEKDYFKTFKDNNFENISKIARYSVMIAGKPKKTGCEIDADFWFSKMSN
jgi:hypothetical protein